MAYFIHLLFLLELTMTIDFEVQKLLELANELDLAADQLAAVADLLPTDIQIDAIDSALQEVETNLTNLENTN